MIRSKTCLVVGAGASSEIYIPEPDEMLGKIAQGFDFARLGTDLHTHDIQVLAKHFTKAAARLGTDEEKLRGAAQAIRTSARIANSIDAILEQRGDDPLVQAAGKIATVHYTLQAEANSPLAREPRSPAELPLRGEENWLFQLGRLVTSGVPRTKADQCFDKLSVVSFNHDRSIQHYLPFIVAMAFGMKLTEARQLVDEKLNVIHTYGHAGRLPWQAGEGPEADWGSEEPANIHAIAMGLSTYSQRQEDRSFLTQLQSAVGSAKRLAFLGFGFEPQNVELLLANDLNQEPDIFVATIGMSEPWKAAVRRMLKRRAGIDDDNLISVLETRSFQFMRDYALFLES